MAETMLVQPDSAFILDLIRSGAGDLKKCMQCGTCSVVCELSPDESPFPRKQMIEAQWGLKAKLVKDPAIWLCHNCGHCTTYCPRGARPGDVFSALRRESIRYFAFPRFMGRLVANPRAALLLFLVPALVFLAIAFWAPKGPATEAMEFANVFPIGVMEPLFFLLSGLALIGFAGGLARFMKATREYGRRSVVQGLPSAITEIVTHERFWQCDTNRAFRLGHLLTLWGFLGLAVVGTLVGIGTMAGLLRTPLPFASTLKIAANLFALLILTGSGMLLWRRLGDRELRAATTYFDWLLVGMLAGVAATGIASQILRLAQVPAMYPVYFVHLVLIFAVFLYAPYSKFAHIAYRTVAVAGSEPWRPKRRMPGCLTEEEAAKVMKVYE